MEEIWLFVKKKVWLAEFFETAGFYSFFLFGFVLNLKIWLFVN